ncbi:MAG: NAD-dependent succinate-semialdehyde dehydrogenase [Gammaproteobacteria bacterium]|nr:NAD-dependent succinate-semialdehyde dehydrogenase [Gammaproteobacteria bacterium]
MSHDPVQLARPDLFRQQALIGGRWVDAADGQTFEVRDPASGQVLGSVPSLAARDMVPAIETAIEAQRDWARRPAAERAEVLMRWHDLMLTHREDLALLMTREQGKPLTEARGEVGYAASFIKWFAEEARRVYGRTIPAATADRRLITIAQPIGVTAAITPWNFPAAMLARKAGPALASGCAMIAKPAEDTPFTALALGHLAQEAGLPDGLLNIVTGDPATVTQPLMDSTAVRKISFTGSTEVGRLLMRQAADTVKKLSLELGGNAPFIVFDDADVEAAVEGVMASKYRNTGQTCVCANRIFVQDAIHDAFVEKLTEATSKLKVGAGTEEGVEQGPLINAAALDKVTAHVKDAREKGGRILIGGKPHARGGHFFEPTVIAGATRNMRLFDEETFGPVAPVFRFTDDDEAVALANDTPFGLASYFYARDLGRVIRVAESLESGIVGVNTGLISTEVAPFGGIKQSGIGREGGHEGIGEYLETKYICIGF